MIREYMANEDNNVTAGVERMSMAGRSTVQRLISVCIYKLTESITVYLALR